MNYEELSDFEINKRVAEYLGFVIFAECDDWFSVLKHHKASSDSEFDPCNNPADAWPIITEMMNDSHVFTISDIAILWHGESDSDDVIIECEYPLRAFMICYLMMQEDK